MMSQDTSACNSTACEERLAHVLTEELSRVLLPVTILVGAEAIVGFLFNLLVLYVYTFRYRFCTWRYFIICLATIDLVACCTVIPGEIVTHRFYYVYEFQAVCKAKTFFNGYTYAVPALLLLAIAFDKYLKISRPDGRGIAPKTARNLCIAFVAAAGVVESPFAVFWGTRSYTKVYKGATINVTICEKSQQFDDTQWPFIHYITLDTMVVLVMSAVVVLYIMIAQNMCRKVAPTAQAPTASSASNMQSPLEGPLVRRNYHDILGQGTGLFRKTLAMFLLTVIFILTLIVYLGLGSGIANSDNILDAMTDREKATYFFFLRLYFINHVVNPIIYGFLDTECRHVIRGMFVCQRSG